MHAALYTGKGTIEIQSASIRGPAAGEVEIAVEFTGICGTDLHIFHGDMDSRVRPPGVIGHEMSGVIARTGNGVDSWAAGDRVTVFPLRPDHTCTACMVGYSYLCHALSFVGIDEGGAMRNRWTVPQELLLRLPDDMPTDHAALIEPTAVAVHDVRRAALRPAEKVLVVGGGPIGVLIALNAQIAGADVLLQEVNTYRLGVAQELGIAIIDGAVDAAARIDQWTDGAGTAVAFEVSGAQRGLDDALASLAVRGRLVLVAIHPTPKPVDLHHIFWRELSILGARLYERQDFETAIRLIHDHQVPVDRLISRTVPLSEAASAFSALESGEVMKVLVDCREDRVGSV